MYLVREVYDGDVSGQESVLSGMCLVGEISIWELSIGDVSCLGNVRQESVCRGSVCWECIHQGNVYHGSVRIPLYDFGILVQIYQSII